MNNYFAGQDILIDESFRDGLEAVVQRREGKAASALHQPFRRNVDVWFFAIMLAVKKGLKPTKPAGQTYKAAEGVVLGSDSWRSTALALLAVSDTGNAGVIENPNEMMRLANFYANAGFPQLFALLDERGAETALDHLCDTVEEMLDD